MTNRQVLKREKGTPFKDHWGEEQSRAIRDIKNRLTTSDPDAEYRIHVDTCNTGYGIGAILLQRVTPRQDKEAIRQS